MLRINFSFVSSSAFVFLGALSGCTTRTDESRGKLREDQKPNILFLFADDQRADALGCSGNTYIKTPNIDRIAQNGIRFTNAYIMGGHHGAISAPSRAMLLSGKYLFNVYDKLDGVTTMPMHFAANGYETFGTGKWHNEQRAFENSFQKGKSVFLGGMSTHPSAPGAELGEIVLRVYFLQGYAFPRDVTFALAVYENAQRGHLLELERSEHDL